MSYAMAEEISRLEQLLGRAEGQVNLWMSRCLTAERDVTRWRECEQRLVDIRALCVDDRGALAAAIMTILDRNTPDA